MRTVSSQAFWHAFIYVLFLFFRSLNKVKTPEWALSNSHDTGFPPRTQGGLHSCPPVETWCLSVSRQTHKVIDRSIYPSIPMFFLKKDLVCPKNSKCPTLYDLYTCVVTWPRSWHWYYRPGVLKCLQANTSYRKTWIVSECAVRSEDTHVLVFHQTSCRVNVS